MNPITGKLCINLHGNDTTCEKYANEGECSINPLWMQVFCRKACDQCVPADKVPEKPASECESSNLYSKT